MKTEPNSPAFAKPASQYTNPANGAIYTDYPANGLTKREYFAAMAMQSRVATCNTTCSLLESGIDLNILVIDAVQCADALIETLNKKEP